jgi:type II secretory pathway pseudopilin PulG
VTSLNIRRFKGVAGFGLFEFVLVVVIISTLVSILIPKIMELKVDAHKSNVQLSANSLRSAVNIIHTLWQSQGSKSREINIKGNEGKIVLVGPRGWPIDVITDNYLPENGLIPVTTLTCERLWNGLLKNSIPELELKIDEEVDTFYQAEFYQGVCRFRYLLSEDGFRIEYDLATGHVDTFF